MNKKITCTLGKLRVLKEIAKRKDCKELISLYIPSGKQIDDVINMLRDEYGCSSNIKSIVTRINVRSSIKEVYRCLKLFEKLPENGLIIFCGAIRDRERAEAFYLIPSKSVHIYLFRLDNRFHLEHLKS